jgi:hypothetical protein
MRAARYHEFGGPEKRQIEHVPQPELNGENVLIQITRAGVSRSTTRSEVAYYRPRCANRYRWFPEPGGGQRKARWDNLFPGQFV